MIQGVNPTLLNVYYIKPGKNTGYQECFEVLYKTEDGQVHLSYEDANADIYIVKPEYRNYNYNKPEERMEKMDKVRTPISKIRAAIADAMGEQGKAFLRHCRDTGDFKRLNQLYAWPYAYGCDFQPAVYFLRDWYSKYTVGHPKLSKSFTDIEIDQIDYSVNLADIRNTAFAPVNVLTVIFEDQKVSHTLILKPFVPSKIGRNEEEYKLRYSLYEHQLEVHQSIMNDVQGFIDQLHQEFDSTYEYIDYRIHEFDEEIELIKYYFKLINDYKPNFDLIWNMRFDIQYMYYRIRNLGYDQPEIMCHPDFKFIRCFFREDNSTYLQEKQSDFFYNSSYTQHMCQMRLYASIRKSQHKLPSIKLNAIADRELKDRKVEYPDETNMRMFPYKDWRRFIIYNIKDVLLQVGIERKCNDVMTYYLRSHSNMTPYEKIFRETHLLRNVREMYFEKEGWVQGNNINILSRPDDKFNRIDDDSGIEVDENGKVSYKGAINADPKWNECCGIMLLDKASNTVFVNGIDFDMAAFYPSIKIACNMDPITLVYKASFNNEEFISGEFNNRSLNQAYFEKDKNNVMRKCDITGEAINTYISGNTLTFCYNYLNCPDIIRLNEIIKNELGNELTQCESS